MKFELSDTDEFYLHYLCAGAWSLSLRQIPGSETRVRHGKSAVHKSFTAFDPRHSFLANLIHPDDDSLLELS